MDEKIGALGSEQPEPGAVQPAMSFETELQRLREELGATSKWRFLWQTDASGRLLQVDGSLLARLGASAIPAIDASFAQCVAGFDPDRAQRLEIAFARRRAWSHETILWPIADGRFAVPLMLGASPQYEGNRQFAGFRGFGVMDLDGIRPVHGAAEDQALDAPVSASPSTEPDGTSADLAPAAQDGEPVLAASVRSSPRPGEPAPQGMEASPRSSPNVVRLRPLQGGTAANSGSAFEPGDSARANGGFEPGGNGSLSSSEHFAFQEIARALGARIEGSELPAEAPDHLPPVRPLDERPGRPGGLDSADLADAAGQDRDRPASDAAPLPEETPGVPIPASDAGSGEDHAAFEGDPHRTDRHGDGAVLRPAPGAAPDIDGPHDREPESAVDAARLRALLDTAGDAIATIDETGRILTLNRQGERWFGRDRRQLAGESFTLLLAPESRAAARALLARIATSPGSSAEISRELVAWTPEGTAMPLLMTLTRIERGLYSAVLRDLSVIKRLESELDRARVEAERARGQQPEFLAKVSHEIRTPLNAILGFAEIMMDERFGSLGNSRYKDYLQDIHASGTRVMSLVNDLLDLSRIEAGRLELELGSVEINKVIGDCVAQLQPEAHRERVIVRTSLGARLPPVRADERSVVQIVTNLLSNAVKFNEPGGQVIVSTALSDTGAVVARIRDTGLGMSDAEIAAALEPFRQSASSNKQAGGAGLGLPLTKALVGANGAALSIRSRLGEGTLVEVMFTPATTVANRVPA